MEKSSKRSGIFAVVLACVCSMAFGAGSYDWSTNPGTGTAENPYQVSTPEQLNSIGTNPDLRSSHFVLTGDIDMSAYTGTDYAVIHSFKGTFDGKGHVIYNLTYSTTENESYVGMFSGISGEVRNLVLEDVTMVSGGDYVGGLAGGGGRITNCQVSGSVRGQNYVGGLAGYSTNGRITNCRVSGSVQGQNSVGGLCGLNDRGEITLCRSSGSLSVSNAGAAHKRFGGVCGSNYWGTISGSYSESSIALPSANDVGGVCGYSDGIITDCVATGSVIGYENVGGLCGNSDHYDINHITRCSAAGDVSGYRSVGGLCGITNHSFLMGCSASGNVTAAGYYISSAGGLCGVASTSTIIQCVATGHVSGEGVVGGMIGQAGSYNVLRQCYALGNASGTFAVGGLCGYCGNYSIFENCYCAGHVSGTGSNVAGFVGQGAASVTGCFWDVEASGQTSGFSWSLFVDPKGLTTAEMQSRSNFIAAGWDFDFMWAMPESGYPKLRWQMGDAADLYPDMDRDGRVDLADYLVLAGCWLAACEAGGDCAHADLDRSGVVDLGDLDRFGRRWLAGTEPEGMEWVYIEDPGLPGYLGFTGYMSRYETTNAQYGQFLNEAMAAGKISVNSPYVGFLQPNGYYDRIYDMSGPGQTADGAVDGGKARISFADGLFTVESGFEDHPVTYVTWNGAKAFCSYYGYRLPEDWEWRAAADFDGSYIYGTGLTINNTLANYEGSVHPNGTTPVGSFGAYGYGLCDMSGNVAEWTNSYNRRINYSLSFRTVVGGYWPGEEWLCRISWGLGISADEPYAVVYPFLGFRVCR